MKSSPSHACSKSPRPIVVTLIISTVLSLSLSPSSSAQTTQPSSAPTSDRASGGLPNPPESSLVDREAALRQAEDDLLKKLNGSLPSSPDTTEADQRNSFIIGSDDPVKPPAAASGAVLADRLSGQPSAASASQSSSDPKSQPEIAPSLLNCPPCAVQASVKPVAQQHAGTSAKKSPARSSGTSRVSQSHSTSSARTQRVEEVFDRRSGACDQGIDDPYVPTSEKARITTSRTHLRLGPGRSESSLFVLPKDAVVSVETRDGEWYRVVTSTGVRGWVAGQFLIFDYDVPERSSVRVGPYNASYEPTGTY